MSTLSHPARGSTCRIRQTLWAGLSPAAQVGDAPWARAEHRGSAPTAGPAWCTGPPAPRQQALPSPPARLPARRPCSPGWTPWPVSAACPRPDAFRGEIWLQLTPPKSPRRHHLLCGDPRQHPPVERAPSLSPGLRARPRRAHQWAFERGHGRGKASVGHRTKLSKEDIYFQVSVEMLQTTETEKAKKKNKKTSNSQFEIKI